METKTKNPIPKISDNHLKEMMDRIRFVNHAMKGTDGKIHHTMEKDPRFLNYSTNFLMQILVKKHSILIKMLFGKRRLKD